LLTPLLLFKKPYITLLFWFGAGFIWSTFVAHNLLSNKLPSELETKDILITGVISSIPEKINRRTRFELSVNSVFYKNKHYSSPKKIVLNWYGDTPKLIPDDKWQLIVRLKRPFGYQNPGGFDYEAWMFQNKIDAKGYVRKSKLNKLIQEQRSIFSFTRTRYILKHEIQSIIKSKNRSIILALLIGDKSEISQTQWQVFRKTGTSHLIAISGLHIGLIAGLVFFITRWLWGYYSFGIEKIPSPKIAAIFAIISAVIYSALADFSLPTQRALIMLCVIMSSILFDVRAQSWKTLAIALFLVLIISPFAVMNPGFWLSFFAVGLILYFSQLNKSKMTSVIYNWSLIQFVISLGLLPLVLLFFNESSIISPVANFIMVPVFSFIIVPLVFLAGCVILIFPYVSHLILMLVTFFLDKLWIFLKYLADLQFSTIQINYLPLSVFIFICVGTVLLLLPRKFPTKYLALVFFMSLFFIKVEKPETNTVKITLLDVGQGLSVVVQTQQHVLVYDTGPRYSESFNTGKVVVMPFLKSRGISKIDMIIISHSDNDHIGGLKSIVNTINVGKILSSVPKKVKLNLKIKNTPSIDYCNSGSSWKWDGVKFEIFHPGIDSSLKNNNASCVLKVSIVASNLREMNSGNSILLTGDIEAEAEYEIIEKQKQTISANIIIAPHHGSKTSSTDEFINIINPEYVLYPVGYRNRYHFPARSVSQRYQDHDVIEYSTSKFGAITFNLNASKIKKPELYRVSHRRFWHN
jgi:competence protein ComEC